MPKILSKIYWAKNNQMLSAQRDLQTNLTKQMQLQENSSFFPDLGQTIQMPRNLLLTVFCESKLLRSMLCHPKQLRNTIHFLQSNQNSTEKWAAIKHYTNFIKLHDWTDYHKYLLVQTPWLSWLFIQLNYNLLCPKTQSINYISIAVFLHSKNVVTAAATERP